MTVRFNIGVLAAASDVVEFVVKDRLKLPENVMLSDISLENRRRV